MCRSPGSLSGSDNFCTVTKRLACSRSSALSPRAVNSVIESGDQFEEEAPADGAA